MTDQANRSEQRSPRGNILLVDDTQANLKLLSNLLKGKGYKVRPAPNASIALQSIQTSLPDLILLDIMMPEMDGFEMCRRLKAQSATQDIPVIFMTALTDVNHIVKGFEMGGVDYITKPFNGPELLARVETHLALKLKEETIVRQNKEYQELLHILFHDLSNPLSALLGTVQLGAKRNPDWLFERRPYLESSVQQAIQVINLVKEMRALEEGKRSIALYPMDLKTAVTQSVAILDQKLVEKSIEVISTVPKSLSVQVELTSFVNSVLNNLLSNAIKFSLPHSKIYVDAKTEVDRVVLTVQDEGIGIPPTLLNQIFTPHKATTRFGTHGEKGTGFGMPLVKKFITAYRGSIEISSSEVGDNHGTTVTVFLQKGT